MSKLLVVCDYDAGWPERFAVVAHRLRERIGDDALRIDHIGSTAVRGLCAKDLIDVQVSVARLEDADAWPDELYPGLMRRENPEDRVSPLGPLDTIEWHKRYWSERQRVHVHVRAVGRANQRYALLFRDYLRADRAAASAYGELKRALAAAAPNDWEAYYAVKNPVCDLIMSAAERWAVTSDWTPGPSDA